MMVLTMMTASLSSRCSCVCVCICAQKRGFCHHKHLVVHCEQSTVSLVNLTTKFCVFCLVFYVCTYLERPYSTFQNDMDDLHFEKYQAEYVKLQQSDEVYDSYSTKVKRNLNNNLPALLLLNVFAFQYSTVTLPDVVCDRLFFIFFCFVCRVSIRLSCGSWRCCCCKFAWCVQRV